MLPIQLAPEPNTFDTDVRQKGAVFLDELVQMYALDLQKRLPIGIDLRPYWRDCLDDLHRSYRGICAYLCIHFERVSGAGSVDHFIAKSSIPALAYEWSNYRLACSTMNGRKSDYDDVLDPFEIEADLFRLQLSTGHLYPNPNLTPQRMRIVEQTIERLKLDDAQCREMRARWYQDYLEYDLPDIYLQHKAPFIWSEAKRQGLLKSFDAPTHHTPQKTDEPSSPSVDLPADQAAQQPAQHPKNPNG